MFVLGADIGTTGVKALLLDEAGHVAGTGYQGYPTQRTAGGMVEQNAEDWWNALASATQQACAGIDASQVAGLSLSTQGGSSLLVDAAGTPLTPALTWMDLRALPQKTALEAEKGGEWFYRKTGWPLNPSLDACKALWMAENWPALLGQASHYLSTVEFLNLRMTGTPVIDPTNAAMRQMMDIQSRAWDEDILKAVRLEPRLLPPIRPSGEELGSLTPQAALHLGLHTGVRVFNGAHDQYCCGLGSGSVAEADTFLGTGTAWAVMHNTTQPLFTASRLSPGPHILPGLWAALSTVSCAGAALDWVKESMGRLDYETIDQLAPQRMRKTRGLFLHPYFTGTGCPQWDSAARATISGLELHHDAYDLALAAMEGVAFQTAALLEEYRANGARIERLRVMGGAGKSQPWMDILAAAAGCEIDRVAVSDAAPLGAGMMAAVGCGWFPGYPEAAGQMVEYHPLPPPNAETRAHYQEKSRQYQNRWPGIQAVYTQASSKLSPSF